MKSIELKVDMDQTVSAKTSGGLTYEYFPMRLGDHQDTTKMVRPKNPINLTNSGIGMTASATCNDQQYSLFSGKNESDQTRRLIQATLLGNPRNGDRDAPFVCCKHFAFFIAGIIQSSHGTMDSKDWNFSSVSNWNELDNGAIFAMTQTDQPNANHAYSHAGTWSSAGENNGVIISKLSRHPDDPVVAMSPDELEKLYPLAHNLWQITPKSSAENRTDLLNMPEVKRARLLDPQNAINAANHLAKYFSGPVRVIAALDAPPQQKVS